MNPPRTPIITSNTPPFQLSRMVADAIAREGTANALAEKINALCHDAGLACRVNRKTLVRIVQCPDQVRFTLAMLRALDRYFTAHNESLADIPVFRRRGVLDIITSSPRVVFLLGAKARVAERRDDISRWDAMAQAELLPPLSRSGPHAELRMETVIWRWPVTAQALAEDRFQAALEDDQAAVISIGSPLSSPASELMMARMFGLEAFTPPLFGPQLSLLPFYFAWRPQVVKRFRSAFALTWRQLLPVDRKLALQLKSGSASCFFCGKRRYLVPVRENSWTIPGVIAAQRRAAGNIWVVLAGLAGPATFAAAGLVKRITAELPWKQGEDSDVLWIPIKARVKFDPANKIGGDSRRVCGIDFAGSPMRFSRR